MSKLIEVYIETYSNDPEFIAEEIMLAFGEKVYQLMQKEGVTKKELSKRTGLSTATLRKVLNDYNPNVKLLALVKIATALDCKVKIVLVEAIK